MSHLRSPYDSFFLRYLTVNNVSSSGPYLVFLRFRIFILYCYWYLLFDCSILCTEYTQGFLLKTSWSSLLYLFCCHRLLKDFTSLFVLEPNFHVRLIKRPINFCLSKDLCVLVFTSYKSYFSFWTLQWSLNDSIVFHK